MKHTPLTELAEALLELPFKDMMEFAEMGSAGYGYEAAARRAAIIITWAEGKIATQAATPPAISNEEK